ncbi:alpha/beta hydrolase fold domain-containing protein [Glaciihabitans arcticus]|nr:alpha/beta hydrolase [Glaciihabitans arcticus]
MSTLGRLMPFIIGLRGSKRLFSSAERTLARVAKHRLRPKSFSPPRSLKNVAVRFEAGWPVYDVGVTSAPRRALYLHGGANIYEIAPQHWSLVGRLAPGASALISVAIYPLAPEGTAGPLTEVAADLVAAMIREVGAQNVTILGDSAGGGMALATAMVLRDRGEPGVGVVMISPSLDLSLSDPDVIETAKIDPWLDIPGASAASELYRGDLPVEHPRVSALNGSLEGLGDLQIFTGTLDMLNPDARRLRARAAEAHHTLEFHEVEGMIHVYPILPIPEAAVARQQIIAFMTR